MNQSGKILLFVSGLPLLGYALLALYACLAYLIIGYWPFPNNPDPKSLGLPALYAIVGWTMAVGVVSLLGGIFWQVIFAGAKWGNWRPGDRKALAVGVSLLLAGWVVYYLDFQGLRLVSWLID